jgi:hypothetical protein
VKKTLPLLLVAAGLLAETPAFAQHRFHHGRSPLARDLPDNALRLEIGGATLSSPGICVDGGPYSDACADTSPFAWQALVLGADVDLALGQGPLNLTLGAHELTAPYYSGNPNIFEPTLGFTFKFGQRSPIQPRLTLGGSALFAEDGHVGGAARLGGGLSFFGPMPFGLAIDLLIDVGSLAGYSITQVQLAIGPELRF